MFATVICNCSMMRFLSLLLLGLCGVSSPWSVCEVVVVPYGMSVVVAVIVMHVLLFVFHVCVMRDCECARVTAMMVWGQGEVWFATSAYMGGTHGSAVLSCVCVCSRRGGR